MANANVLFNSETLLECLHERLLFFCCQDTINVVPGGDPSRGCDITLSEHFKAIEVCQNRLTFPYIAQSKMFGFIILWKTSLPPKVFKV